MGLGSLILQGIFISYLFGCVYAFYYGWTKTAIIKNGNNNSNDNSNDSFAYTAMWQDINND